MKCPIDGTTLLMTTRSGVEIDYCPTCRGVWLDRGELDKILEAAAPVALREPPPGAEARVLNPEIAQPPAQAPRADVYRHAQPYDRAPDPRDDRRQDERYRNDRDRDDDRYDHGKPYKKKSRARSILDDIFDF